MTVAEDITLDDPQENLGAQLVKEAASKTNKIAGDGTTTATVLAEAIYREGLKMIAGGADPDVAVPRHPEGDRGRRRRRRQDGHADQRKEQEGNHPGRHDRRQQRPTIGAVLADAFMKVGKDGVITVEEGKQSETTVDVVEGMQFDRGFLSPHFVTNQDEQTVELEKLLVLIDEDKISNAKNLVPLLEAVSRANKPLLIIAEDVEGEALATLVVNKIRGILERLCRQGPGLRRSPQGHAGRHRRPTGGKAIFKDLGVQLDSMKLSDLGTVDRVIISADDTTIVGAAATRRPSPAGPSRSAGKSKPPPAITIARSLKSVLPSLPAAWPRSASGRPPKPSEGAEVPPRRRQAATQAALEEGIVPGGGVALLRCEKAVDALQLEGDEALGAKILRNVLEVPLKAIANNAGRTARSSSTASASSRRTRATTPTRTPTATCSRPASSIRPRSFAPPCRTP